MFSSILVPLDGSPFGEQALPWAVAIARAARAVLHLTHVHEPIVSLYSGSDLMADLSLEDVVRDQERAYLEHRATELAEHTEFQARGRLLEGGVVDSLQQYAEKLRAELMVMTTHGYGPLGRFWLGGVADKLLRHVSTPTILVRPKEDRQEPKPDFRNILVPLDGSPLAEHALEPATTLAKLMKAEITLVRVVEPELFAGNRLPTSVLSQLLEESRSYLAKIADGLRARSFTVEATLLVDRFPADAIINYAAKHGVSLIALETHGYSGWKRLLLGSVADKIIRGSPVPVLIQHPVHSARTDSRHDRLTKHQNTPTPAIESATPEMGPPVCHGQGAVGS